MSTPPNVPKPSTTLSPENVANASGTLSARPLPKPDGLGTLGRDEFEKAVAAATDVGQRIAREFDRLDQRQRHALVRMFRRQLLPPGKPGRRRSQEITAAYANWKAGVRGLPLYRKHIRGFDRMGYWKRKGKTRALLEALRSRDRRERKVKRDGARVRVPS